jgi:hypothetical protein
MNGKSRSSYDATPILISYHLFESCFSSIASRFLNWLAMVTHTATQNFHNGGWRHPTPLSRNVAHSVCWPHYAHVLHMLTPRTMLLGLVARSVQWYWVRYTGMTSKLTKSSKPSLVKGELPQSQTHTRTPPAPLYRSRSIYFFLSESWSVDELGNTWFSGCNISTILSLFCNRVCCMLQDELLYVVEIFHCKIISGLLQCWKLGTEIFVRPHFLLSPFWFILQ